MWNDTPIRPNLRLTRHSAPPTPNDLTRTVFHWVALCCIGISIGVFAFVVWRAVVHAQVACFDYGTMVSCDGPDRENFLLTPFSDRSGYIQRDFGNGHYDSYPYTIFPERPRSQSYRNDTSDSYLNPYRDLDRELSPSSDRRLHRRRE
jgi:hypothetical protein